MDKSAPRFSELHPQRPPPPLMGFAPPAPSAYARAKALPTRHPNTIQQAPIGGKTGPQRASDETNAKQHEGREGGSILVPPASGPPSGDGSPAGASRPRPHGRASPPPAAVAAAPLSQQLPKPGALPPPPIAHRSRQINAQGIKRLMPMGRCALA